MLARFNKVAVTSDYHHKASARVTWNCMINACCQVSQEFGASRWGQLAHLTEILLVLLRQFQSFVGTLLEFVLTTSVQSS